MAIFGICEAGRKPSTGIKAILFGAFAHVSRAEYPVYLHHGDVLRPIAKRYSLRFPFHPPLPLSRKQNVGLTQRPEV
ncbi:MAG TPA: hypothetical protein DD990_02935 [Cyanobacteria bacterium UBA11368]|nr:hypothetical protein [Cyanobacteria bacterium UBA11368]